MPASRSRPTSIRMRSCSSCRKSSRSSAATRDKERRWGPRTLDLDMIAYDDVSSQKPDLTLPHPRLFERAFVLVPLAEIAPDRVISGIRVRDGLAGVSTQTALSGFRIPVNQKQPFAGDGPAVAISPANNKTFGSPWPYDLRD